MTDKNGALYITDWNVDLFTDCLTVLDGDEKKFHTEMVKLNEAIKNEQDVFIIKDGEKIGHIVFGQVPINCTIKEAMQNILWRNKEKEFPTKVLVEKIAELRGKECSNSSVNEYGNELKDEGLITNRYTNKPDKPQGYYWRWKND